MKAIENQEFWLQFCGRHPFPSGDVLIGHSPAIQRLRRTIQKLGPADVRVLLTGEPGTGQERAARSLHQAGPGGPFVAFNCMAVPAGRLGAEIFGVEQGSQSRPGLLEQAHGGTLFLDEIGNLDLSLQPRLLHFLDRRCARRMGGASEYTVNTRVIAATSHNLEVAIDQRRFRADLYYRLAEIILQIPPLRTRAEDIPDLAQTFLRHANERYGRNFAALEPELVERLQQYDWPGNVRELKRAIDRLALLFDGPVLRASWWDTLESHRAEPTGPADLRSTNWAQLPIAGRVQRRSPARPRCGPFYRGSRRNGGKGPR